MKTSAQIFVCLVTGFLSWPLPADEAFKPFEIEIYHREKYSSVESMSFRVLGNYNSKAVKNIWMAFPENDFVRYRNLSLKGPHIAAFFDFALDHSGNLWIKRMRFSSEFVTYVHHLEANHFTDNETIYQAHGVTLEGPPFVLDFSMKGLGDELDVTMSKRKKYVTRLNLSVRNVISNTDPRLKTYDRYYIQRSKKFEEE